MSFNTTHTSKHALWARTSLEDAVDDHHLIFPKIRRHGARVHVLERQLACSSTCHAELSHHGLLLVAVVLHTAGTQILAERSPTRFRDCMQQLHLRLPQAYCNCSIDCAPSTHAKHQAHAQRCKILSARANFSWSDQLTKTCPFHLKHCPIRSVREYDVRAHEEGRTQTARTPETGGAAPQRWPQPKDRCPSRCQRALLL
jgi:hypothetical protein